jgi:hypothetical protein
MKLNLTARIVFTGVLIAVLSACGSGSPDSPDSALTAVQSDTANFIDKNKNGVKDSDEVYDANHNDVDDDAECLGGDDDHNGRIEGAENHHNDSDHDGVDDDKDDDYKGVKGQCSGVNENEDDNDNDNEDDNDNDNDNDNDSNDNDDKKRK